MKRDARGRRLAASAGLLLLGFAYGYLAHRNGWFPHGPLRRANRAVREMIGKPMPTGPDVRWVKRSTVDGNDPGLERLRALPYAQGHVGASGSSGVLRHDPARAQAGLNLYVSGHAPEAILMTMEGRTVHTWRRAFSDLWPEAFDPGNVSQLYWRRVRLLPDGGVVALFDYEGILRLDRSSRPIWSRRGGFHHDLTVDEHGTIWVLGSQGRTVEGLHGGRPLLDDLVIVLGPDGEERRRVSILDAFLNSPFAPALAGGPAAEQREDAFDLMHNNTIEILRGPRLPGLDSFRDGNVLLSLRERDLVAVLDPDQERIVWAMTGMWHRQHDPRLLPDGKILLFDNAGNRGWSKVIEFDPVQQVMDWSYEGSERNGFRSTCCGTNQRLANGNTLITDTTNGRAFEVTPAGEVVWEFVNPNTAGEDDALVAVIMDLIRVEPGPPWLGAEE